MNEMANSPQHGPLERLLRRMPAEISASFTEPQRQALRRALGEIGWRRLPIDLRFTIWLPFRSFFVTLLAGQEKRNRERLRMERQVHPIRTIGNVLFIIGMSAAFVLVALVLLLVLTNILVF